jgi:hypothetical protein
MQSLAMSLYEMVTVTGVKLADYTLDHLVFFEKFITIHLIKNASLVTEARQSPS